MNGPVLSVVLTVVDGGEALRRCLRALLAQQDAPAMEILIPADAGIAPDVAAAVSTETRDAATVRILDLGRLQTGTAAESSGGQHELFDRRRAAGLAAARGEVIAILEDRGVPRKDWATTAVRLHRELPHAVIGGAVENGRDRLLNWAVYYSDFGRYQLPFAAGRRRYVTDVNVTYKRRALDTTRDLWRDRYHEPIVHWALERAGDVLFVSPALVVDQIRDDLTLMSLIRERLAWGRLFGALRVAGATPLRRYMLVGLSPFVPVVLFARFIRDRLVKRSTLWPAARSAGAVAVLLVAWTLGETVGALTKRSSPMRQGR